MENIKKDVWLSIHSTQSFEGCPQEEVNLVTAARLYRKNDKYYIAYDESEITGLEGTRTTLKIDGKTVALIRTGRIASELLFLERQRHVGLYQTPYGMATIATHTSRIQNTIGEGGGALVIDYTVEIDHSVAGSHHFEMTVATQPFVQ